MENVVNKVKDFLDYENNYYFYHETDNGYGENICEEGLYLSGNNILGVKNLLYTTTAPLSEDITSNETEFIDFLSREKQTNGLRKVTEMVILGIPKDDIDFAVDRLDNGYQPDSVTNYIIRPQYVLGYIDLENEDLIINENYFDYYDDYTY